MAHELYRQLHFECRKQYHPTRHQYLSMSCMPLTTLLFMYSISENTDLFSSANYTETVHFQLSTTAHMPPTWACDELFYYCMLFISFRVSFQWRAIFLEQRMRVLGKLSPAWYMAYSVWSGSLAAVECMPYPPTTGQLKYQCCCVPIQFHRETDTVFCSEPQPWRQCQLHFEQLRWACSATCMCLQYYPYSYSWISMQTACCLMVQIK